MLQRQSLTSDGIYLIYNAFAVFIFVGSQADPSLIEQLYKVQEFAQINMIFTEEEMFADVDGSPYLTALYSIINQVRYQRAPFCALKTLLEGDTASEATLQSVCVLDTLKAGYTIEYQRFM